MCPLLSVLVHNTTAEANGGDLAFTMGIEGRGPSVFLAQGTPKMPMSGVAFVLYNIILIYDIMYSGVGSFVYAGSRGMSVSHCIPKRQPLHT